MAKVRQSAAGASAVTAIWSIVRKEMCSDVSGSKSMIVPESLPIVLVLVGKRIHVLNKKYPFFSKQRKQFAERTKSNCAITHPRNSCQIAE